MTPGAFLRQAASALGALETPLAVGDCAVGAIGGITSLGVFAIANAGDIVSGNISEAKAVAKVVQNRFWLRIRSEISNE